MRKRLTAATLAALMALSMTACSGGKAAETTAAPETKETLPAIWYDAATGTAVATTANYPSPCVRRPNVSWSFRVLPAM